MYRRRWGYSMTYRAGIDVEVVGSLRKEREKSYLLRKEKVELVGDVDEE